jgi:hypothetical protein
MNKEVRVASRMMKFTILRHLRETEGFSSEPIMGGPFGDNWIGENYLVNGEVLATQSTDKTLRLIVSPKGYVL